MAKRNEASLLACLLSEEYWVCIRRPQQQPNVQNNQTYIYHAGVQPQGPQPQSSQEAQSSTKQY